MMIFQQVKIGKALKGLKVKVHSVVEQLFPPFDKLVYKFELKAHYPDGYSFQAEAHFSPYDRGWQLQTLTMDLNPNYPVESAEFRFVLTALRGSVALDDVSLVELI